MGTAELYEWLDHQEAVRFLPVEYINTPMIIAANRNMLAINGALMLDLAGQVHDRGQSFQRGEVDLAAQRIPGDLVRTADGAPHQAQDLVAALAQSRDQGGSNQA